MFEMLKRNSLFLGPTILVLFLSFSIDFFGAMNTGAFTNNFKDSEALVTNQINCRGTYFSDQLLEVKISSGAIVQAVCDPTSLKAYSSQYGLQGKIYTLAYKGSTSITHISTRAFVALAQLTTALMTALCFALLALWVKRRYGLFVANTFTFFVAISPMIVGFARNLYWALPLMFAPLIYILYFYEGAKSYRSKALFWVGLATLLYIRYLCGYEYITTLTIMLLAAITYFLILSSASKKRVVSELSIAFVVSVVSFTLALGTHIYSLKSSTGSFSAAASVVKNRALARTTGSADYLAFPINGLRANLNDVYQVSNSYLYLDEKTQNKSEAWATLVSFVNYTFLPVVSIPIALNQPFGVYSQSVLVYGLLLTILFYKRKVWLSKTMANEVRALSITALVGFIGFLSWLVMARSHSLVHAHINGILLYLPFALFGYMVIGIYLQVLVSKIRLRKK